jgi:hypothetical protein
MAAQMTPQDDRLAALLIEVGFSLRQAAEFMRRSDKSVKAAVDRAKKRRNGLGFTARQERLAKHLLGFYAWLDKGRRRGYLEALAAFLDGDEH